MSGEKKEMHVTASLFMYSYDHHVTNYRSVFLNPPNISEIIKSTRKM